MYCKRRTNLANSAAPIVLHTLRSSNFDRICRHECRFVSRPLFVLSEAGQRVVHLP